MWKSIVCTLFLGIPLFSQISFENFTILDSYYGNHLIASDSMQLVKNKVYFPGLNKDTVSTVAIGILAHQIKNVTIDYPRIDYTVTSHSDLRVSDLYGWAETEIKSGKLGGWIGNVDFVNTETSYSVDSKDGNVTGAVALWFTPRRDLEFKGLSVVASGLYDYSDENSLNQPPNEYGSNQKDNKNIDIVVNSMIQCNKRFNLALRFLTNYYLYQTDYNRLTNAEYYFSNSKISKINMGIVVSLIDRKRRNLTITLKESKINADYESSTYQPGESSHTGSGDAFISLDYSDSHVFRYLKHNLYYGLKTAGTVTFPIADNYNYKIEFNDIARNIDKNEYSLDWYIMAPVMFDINLFKSSMYAMIKISPAIVAKCTRSDRNKNSESQSIKLKGPELAIGIRGKIGERFEFALVPNFSSTVFVAGLEMKYLIPGEKSQRCKLN